MKLKVTLPENVTPGDSSTLIVRCPDGSEVPMAVPHGVSATAGSTFIIEWTAAANDANTSNVNSNIAIDNVHDAKKAATTSTSLTPSPISRSIPSGRNTHKGSMYMCKEKKTPPAATATATAATVVHRTKEEITTPPPPVSSQSSEKDATRRSKRTTNSQQSASRSRTHIHHGSTKTTNTHTHTHNNRNNNNPHHLTTTAAELTQHRIRELVDRIEELLDILHTIDLWSTVLWLFFWNSVGIGFLLGILHATRDYDYSNNNEGNHHHQDYIGNVYHNYKHRHDYDYDDNANNGFGFFSRHNL
jgi:hypothetical protein